MTARSRFLAKIVKTPSCWLWNGCVLRSGYGQFWMNGKVLAHRASWVLFQGPIPAGLLVLHRCDNRLCVRPDHLFLGDTRDNAVDCAEKGRGGFQQPGLIERPRGEAHGLSKLTEDDVRTIRQLAYSGLSQPEIGARYGVAHSTIGRILRGETWCHVPGGRAEVRT